MSGPKVVRIVTREEQVASGNALLARLDTAFGQWLRDCGTQLTEVEIENTKGRRNALADMLLADRFAEFGKFATEEIDFLLIDAERQIQRAANARAQERIRQASGQEMAKGLLIAGHSMTLEMRAELEQAAVGHLSLTELDSVLMRARQTFFQVVAPSVSNEQMALALRLGSNEAESNFDAWRTKAVKPDLRLNSLFSHLSELEVNGFLAEANELEEQLHLLKDIGEEATRSMRLDTLVLSVRNVKDAAFAKMKLLRQIELMAAQISVLAPGSGILEKLQEANPASSHSLLQSLLAMGQEDLEKARLSVAATARRTAILSGLQKLGYEVQEGLSTMTNENGRLIFRSPGETDYGVELLTGVNQKVQVRSVAFNGARDNSQDLAEEHRWCGDFSKLESTLKRNGCEVMIEKALGVGAAPLRVIDEIEERRHRESISKDRSKSR